MSTMFSTHSLLKLLIYISACSHLVIFYIRILILNTIRRRKGWKGKERDTASYQTKKLRVHPLEFETSHILAILVANIVCRSCIFSSKQDMERKEERASEKEGSRVVVSFISLPFPLSPLSSSSLLPPPLSLSYCNIEYRDVSTSKQRKRGRVA